MSGHNGLRLGFMAGAAALALALGVLAASQAFAQPETLRLGRITLATGSEHTLDLEALDIGPPGIGAWTIDISFNSSVVQLTNCDTIAGGLCNPEFGDGTVRLVGATASGLEGDTVLASLTFRCLMPGSTAVSIGVDEFADATQAELQPISVDVVNGAIGCVAAQPPIRLGDVNCDGRVDAVDAALVLQYSAGLIHTLPCPQNGDVNNDGRIDAVDAALILQVTAGLFHF